MISFRFHLVSLVAVFLALGLGVLTGTTVLNRGIVAQLERQTDQLARNADLLRQDVRDLQRETDMWAQFGQTVMEPLVGGRLEGDRLLMVTQAGTDEASIAAVNDALRMAGAEVMGPLVVTERMALDTDADRSSAAEVLGVSADEDPDVLAEGLASALARRLMLGPTRTDVLSGLMDAGLVVNEGARLGEQELQVLGGPGDGVVVVGGWTAPPPLRPARFLVPLVEDLAAAGAPVAAAEPVGPDGTATEPFVALLRADGEVRASVATQDNVDQVPGQIGLVLAVDDVLQGVTGHYGVKDGASGVIPELEA